VTTTRYSPPFTEGDIAGIPYFPRITGREHCILRLVSEGCTNKQIGSQLLISKYTVAQHIAKMLRRTGACNRTDLVHRADIAGILSSERFQAEDSAPAPEISVRPLPSAGVLVNSNRQGPGETPGLATIGSAQA
jgi:DNA-binding CsgD family transcriptional regulator